MNVIDLTMLDSDEEAAAPVAPANTGTIDLCYSSSDEAEAGAAPNAAPTAPENAHEVPKNAPPLGRVDPNAGGAKVEIEVAEYVKPKSAADLQKELDAANAEIERLKKKLADAGISA